jgi:hypothetical protein
MASSPYLSVVRAFTCEVELTVTDSNLLSEQEATGLRTAFRIAGPSRRFVEEELERLLERATGRRAAFMFLGPVWWEPVWVVHGEIQEVAPMTGLSGGIPPSGRNRS